MLGWFGVTTLRNESWILGDNEFILGKELVDVPTPGSGNAVRVIM